MGKDREIVFDAIKLFAIFLVGWGHAIAYMQTADYTHNRIYLAIYSFHMPLFMTVVGFFSKSVSTIKLGKIIRVKARQLLLPAIAFYLPLAVGVYVKSGFETMIHGYISAFWFLKSAFFCYLLYFATKRLCHNGAVAVVLSLFISMFIRDFGVYRMYPYFLLGMFIGGIYARAKTCSGLIVVVSGAVFLGLIPLFDSEVYNALRFSPLVMIFTCASQEPADVINTLLWVVIGGAGSVFFIFLFYYISTKVSFGRIGKKIATLGRETLAVYLFNTVFIELPPKYIGHLDGMETILYNMVVTPLLSVSVIVVTHYIVKLIGKRPVLAFLILGKQLEVRRDGPEIIAGNAESLGS